ncbi:MAG: hypothetical protein ACK6CU_21960, partial [Deltaproteobacteria bacterium]
TAGEMHRAFEDWLARYVCPIADGRLARTVGGFFSAAEKQPLPANAAQFTGTFAALTGARSSEPDVAVDVGQPEWAQTFSPSDRLSSRPPASRRPVKPRTLLDRFFELSPIAAFAVTLGLGGAVLALLLGLYLALRS